MIKWFETLTDPEKSLVLTTIDAKLVKLITTMFKYYRDYGNGKFYNDIYHTDEPNSIVRIT